MSDWRAELQNLLNTQPEAEEPHPQEVLRSRSTMVSTFLSEDVIPAFEELRAEFTKYDREVSFFRDRDSISIDIDYQDRLELKYSIVIKYAMGRLNPEVEIRYSEGISSRKKTILQPFGELDPENPLAGIHKQDIIDQITALYQEYAVNK